MSNPAPELVQKLWNYFNPAVVGGDDGLSCAERRLSAVDGLEAVVSANFQRAARLGQSHLQKAFSGKLFS